MLITQACKSLNAVCEAKQSTQLEMQRLAAMLPEYEVVMRMEGAGPVTGPALMAEIGDVRRFKNKKALVAFAGIDAPPFQSGAFESKSRHVSKRGSPHLRRTIFIVSNIILTRFNTLKPGKCCLLLYGQKAFRRKALLRLYRRRKCEVPASLLRSCY